MCATLDRANLLWPRAARGLPSSLHARPHAPCMRLTVARVTIYLTSDYQCSIDTAELLRVLVRSRGASEHCGLVGHSGEFVCVPFSGNRTTGTPAPRRRLAVWVRERTISQLKGRKVLVTGAASKRGIGHAVALRLAQEGADVAVNDLALHGNRFASDDQVENWQGLSSVVEQIRSMGCKALAVEANIAQEDHVQKLVDTCVSEFGCIDILINNAGVTGPIGVTLYELDVSDWNRVLGVNLTGAHLCAAAVARQMIENRIPGKIINISSMSGKIGAAGWGAYSVSKFGLIGLTQVLALELASYKINVNAVCPGFVATEFNLGAGIRRSLREERSLDEATAQAYSDVLPQIPLNRAAQPSDVASVVAFLASRDADYMTGQALNVSGGAIMCH